MGVAVMGVWNLLVPESENSFDFYGREKMFSEVEFTTTNFRLSNSK